MAFPQTPILATVGGFSPSVKRWAFFLASVYQVAMKEEIRYRWRIQWTGRWTTTRYHCTEEHIRKENPEAVSLYATRREVEVAEKEAERKGNLHRTSLARLGA